MKKNIILTFSLFISILSYSQLKVMPSGYVGIGTNNPLLILSIQEQQLQIENLQTIILSQEQEIISLTNTVNGCCFELSEKSTNVDDNTLQNEAKLYQNNPNPFSVSTNIKYSIPNKFMSAYLNIYNLNGGQIKSYKISNVGNGNIKIDGLELNPGMYLYSLIIDNNIIDTKKMVLTD